MPWYFEIFAFFVFYWMMVHFLFWAAWSEFSDSPMWYYWSLRYEYKQLMDEAEQAARKGDIEAAFKFSRYARLVNERFQQGERWGK